MSRNSRKKKENKQTIINEYNITNNYYINNDINSNNKEKTLDNLKNNTQDKNSSLEETVNKKKDLFSNQLISYIPFIYSITFLILCSIEDDSVTLSNIILLYSTSITFSIEINEWIKYHYIKTGKENILYKITNFLNPILYFMVLFIISFLLAKFVNLINKEINVNLISLIILLITTIFAGIRETKIKKLSK